MSDTTAGGHVGEPAESQEISADDLRRMLDEARGERTKLQEQLDSERRQRQSVERDRDTHAARVVSETEQRYNAELNAASTAFTSASSEVSATKQAIKTALSEGNHDLVADLHEQLAGAVHRRNQAESYKGQLERNKEQLLRPSQSQPPTDRVAGIEVMPEEKHWLSSRPRFETDAAYRNDVIRASQAATEEGYRRGSRAYFRHMEEVLGENRRAEERHDDEPETRRPSADVAPNRRPAPGAQTGRVRVELSAFEREIADGMYGDPSSSVSYIADPAARYEHYAKNRDAMKAAGRM